VKTVLTVILNWRTPVMTLEAAEAALVAMEGIGGEILIVDNDSCDGSEEALRAGVAEKGWTRVHVVQAGHNGGFGAGNNVGIRRGLSDGSRPDFVYVLNSDAFPEPEAIRALVACLEAHPDVAMAGSSIHGETGESQVGTFRFPGIASEFEGGIRFGPVTKLLARHVVPIHVPQDGARVDWMSGCSLLIRDEVFRRVGVFDEVYFLYFEETDLCLRSARAGMGCAYVAASRVMHLGSVTTGMKEWSEYPDYWYDSRYYYFARNYGRLYALGAMGAHWIGAFLFWFRCKVTGKPRGLPRRYLRRLLLHDLRATFRPIPPRRASVLPVKEVMS
jgi:N-acetylglucosaminyl-diphospho-decaprenol L-rhamnosyltransferase